MSLANELKKIGSISGQEKKKIELESKFPKIWSGITEILRNQAEKGLHEVEGILVDLYGCYSISLKKHDVSKNYTHEHIVDVYNPEPPAYELWEANLIKDYLNNKFSEEGFNEYQVETYAFNKSFQTMQKTFLGGWKNTTQTKHCGWLIFIKIKW